MQTRRNQRSARLWPWLLLVPAAIALIDLGRRTSSPPDAAPEAQQAQQRAAPAARDQSPRRARRPRAAPEPPQPPDREPPVATDAPAARRIDPCGGVSPYGTCAGDVASACVGGRVTTIDCAATGERCVMTREGASCLPNRGAALDCSPADAPVCDGNVLRQCVDGSWQGLDCAMRLARCDVAAERARCTASAAAAGAIAALAGGGDAIETCDGEDQDGDGATDEAGVCDEIALVAFVPPGANLRDLQARMQAELAIANRVFHPLTFEWRRILETPLAPLAFHPRMFGELEQSLSHVPGAGAAASASASASASADAPGPSGVTAGEAADGFYIPVLFAESIATSPPKAGMSTLPNARCGGVRVSDQPAPAEGLIVMSEARQPETLAHELGHYLGLCHTHEDLAGYGVAGVPAAPCEGSGDGICDTAFDPGPPHCAELPTCAPQCEGVAAEPDTTNVMSYYMMCRRGLSPQQLAEAERNLSLRRGWFRCLDPGACPCTPGDPGACPAEMSCQPVQRMDGGGECVLDGPALPGAPCAHLGDCSRGAICLGARNDTRPPRCARACIADGRTCACTDVGLPYRVCREDLE